MTNQELIKCDRCGKTLMDVRSCQLCECSDVCTACSGQVIMSTINNDYSSVTIRLCLEHYDGLYNLLNVSKKHWAMMHLGKQS